MTNGKGEWLAELRLMEEENGSASGDESEFVVELGVKARCTGFGNESENGSLSSTTSPRLHIFT